VPVYELVDSLVGTVADVSDKNIKTLTREIFNPKDVGMEDFIKFRDIMMTENPAAWNAVVKAEANRRLARFTDILEQEGNKIYQNEPRALLNALFGSGTQRQMFLNALPGEMRKNALMLEDYLKSASVGRRIGSPTASRGEQIERLSKTPAGIVTSYLTSPKQAFKDMTRDRVIAENARLLSEFMVDPTVQRELMRVRRLGNGRQAGRVLSNILATWNKVQLQPMMQTAQERRGQIQ